MEGARVASNRLSRPEKSVWEMIYPRSWTVPLLQHHLCQQHRLVVSGTTLRRTLHAWGYRWKRPRYVLAHRDPLRQKKTGCLLRVSSPRSRTSSARLH